MPNIHSMEVDGVIYSLEDRQARSTKVNEPSSEGTNGQVLTTDGNGVRSWSSLPNKTSDFTNDSGFITNTVNDLANYYLKTGTYSKAEVNALISAIDQFAYEVVSTLPTASASTMNKIYLVPSAHSEADNIKDEYITIDNGSGAETRYTWEQIGSTAVDLSDYYTKSETNTVLNNKQDKLEIITDAEIMAL